MINLNKQHTYLNGLRRGLNWEYSDENVIVSKMMESTKLELEFWLVWECK